MARGVSDGLDPAQRAAADRGLKGLIPFHGHPFLAHVLSRVADAGIRRVCLVVRPGPDPIRAHFEACPGSRLRIEFVEQERPLGSADALLAAEPFANGEPVVVLNGDNLYPASVIDRVRRLPGSGLAGFRAAALAAQGNIPRGRVAAFAVAATGPEGCLESLVEKPDAGTLASFGPDPLVSMTCWRFLPSVFPACRALAPSPRGELELPDAALALVQGGACLKVETVEAGVLDLTEREDIPEVSRRLEGCEVLP
jgi:dTDP-glucose pyrophosphorylase